MKDMDEAGALIAEMGARARKAAEVQRAAEAALRVRAAAAEGKREPSPPPPPAEPEPVKAAPIRTDYGSKLVDMQKWRPKVVDVTKVPEHVLKSPKVIAAIEQVSRDLMKNGIDVPGVIKETYNTHSIS